MPYVTPLHIIGDIGNHTFAYSCHQEGRGIRVAPCITGDIADLHMSRDIAFAETGDGSRGVVQESCGLDSFVRTEWEGIPTTIVDNHHHVLYFWHEAMVSGIVPRGIPIVHVDMHSDLWANEHYPWELLSDDHDAVYRYVNYRCQVGNYLVPALASGCISRVVRIEGEYDMDSYIDPDGDYIANIDIDFFAPDMDYIDLQKRINFVRKVMRHARYITIATSP